MKHRIAIVILILAVVVPALAREPYFSLSSDRTYMPGEKPTVHMYATGVEALEFRVYRVNDPVTFFEKLDDVHSFGHASPKEQVEEKTWIERFHDWKYEWWLLIRDFFRYQFSAKARAEIRRSRAEKSKSVNATGFLQLPLLNSKQLVGRWRQQMPPQFVSESLDVPLELSTPGIYLVEATDGDLRAYTIVVVSEIGLITKTAPGQFLNYLVDRRSGKPIPDSAVVLWANGKELAQLKTDANGLAATTVTLPSSREGENQVENVWALARHRDDAAIVAPYSFNLSSNPAEDWVGYIYTDRPIYRPGHTVHFKGIVRQRNGEHYQIPAGSVVQASIEDSSSKQLYQKELTLSQYGTVHGEFEIPQGAALGYYSLSFRYLSAQMNGSFYVEEYKKPEYQVKVSFDQPRVLQGQSVKATIDARYYFGEPVANGKVKYVVHTAPSWSDFMSEEEGDYGAEGEEGVGGDDDYSYGGEQQSEQSGQLDANGKLTITIATKPSPNKRDVRYRVEARVMDASNREISSYNNVLATYGSFQITVRPQSYLYRKGETAQFSVLAKDYDGKPVQTAVRLELIRNSWTQSRRRKEDVIANRDGQTGVDGTAQFDIPMSQAGDLMVRVTSTSPENREVSNSSYVWVPGSNQEMYGAGERQIKLVPDKKSYKVGETAKVLLVTGVPEAYVLITTEARTIQTKQVIKASGANTTFEVPITADNQPNVYVSATFLKDNNLYQGSKNLSVPAVEQILNVDVEPSKPQFQPGEPASYTITAKDGNGKPVAGEFSIGVVDEAIYAIRPDNMESISSFFYGNTYNRVSTDSSLNFYFHGEAGKRQMQLANRGLSYRALAQLKPTESLVQPKVRKAFPDTALWLADVKTNAQGRAEAKLEFPDSLTTWRATVRGATLDTKVGSATQRVIVRKNMMVRLAVPRFFRQGDEITVSAIVHNYLDSTKNVQVSMEVAGLDVISGSTQQISVGSGGDTKADWRVRVKNVREAKLLAKALTNEESDAMELTLPVVPYGVKLADAKSGSISEPNGQSDVAISYPPGTEVSSHGLDITVTPSIAGAILGALDYLTSYPYGCTEQTMSSFLPNIIVAKTLQDLHLEYKGASDELQKKIRAGMDRLYDFQHEDGGWGWWKDDESQVFITAYVVSGLGQAKASGYEVKSDVIQKGQEYLRAALKKYTNMRADLQAYVVYALAGSGASDAAVLNSTFDKRARMSSQGLAVLGLTLQTASDARANEIADTLERKAKVDAAQAYWPSDYDYWMEFAYDDGAESTALALRFLSLARPNSQLLPKAAQWLANHRNEGYYWNSTKQTAIVISGLAEYLKISHELEADFTADVLVNDKPVLTRKFTKADTTTISGQSIHLNFDQLAAGENNIRIRKNGVGRLYWSARGEYYSTDKKVVQSNQLSLNITRDYFRLSPITEKGSEGDKIVYELQPLTGTLAPGDVVAVRLTVGGGEWRYLMVEDPIPAGAEFLEKDDLYEIKGRPDWWSYYFSRREFHDDRAAMFQTYFKGKQTYFYLVKMVNPGVFHVSPALAQPMYQPSVLATTDSQTVEVK